MQKLSLTDLNRKSVDEFKRTEKSPFVIILDNIRSQNNIGSVFRTSDAFLADKIFLCGITAIPPSKEIHKTALGSTNSVCWEYIKNPLTIISKLKQEGYKIVSVEQTDESIMLNDFVPDKKKKYAFIFGNEVKGVNQDVINASDFALEIPQYGTKHSLNVSVSAGIIIWDVYLKMKL